MDLGSAKLGKDGGLKLVKFDISARLVTPGDLAGDTASVDAAKKQG